MIPIRTIVINLTLLMLLEMAIAPFLLIGDVVTYIEIRQLGIMIFIGLNQFIALTIFPTAAAIILALAYELKTDPHTIPNTARVK